MGEHQLSRNISYFAQRTNIPLYYQVHMGEKDYEVAEFKARVIPFTTMASILAV